MTEDDYAEELDASYIRGEKAAWSRLLTLVASELDFMGDDEKVKSKVAELWAERDAAIAALRDVCAEYGDLDWDDDLHLADIIEKHLGRPLRRNYESTEPGT